MLVIEGIDKLGKSTAVAEAVERLQAMRAAIDPDGEPVRALALDASARTWRPRQYVSACAPWTVVDRFHVSEWVYGKALRGRSGLDQFAMGMIDQAIAQCGGHTLVLTAPAGELEQVLAQAGGRSDDDPTTAQLKDLNARFSGYVVSQRQSVGDLLPRVRGDLVRADGPWPAEPGGALAEALRWYALGQVWRVGQLKGKEAPRWLQGLA